MAIKILQIDLQNDITPQIGSYDNAGGVTPNNWFNEGGVYSLGPTNVDGTTPYYWFTPTREVTDFDLCWEDYQDRSQTTPQYHLEIGDSAGNVVLSAFRTNASYSIGPVGVGNPAYQTWHKILIEVRKASASSSTVTAYVDGKKIDTGTSATLLTSAKIALLGHVPDSYYWQNAGQRLRYVTIYDRSYSSKGVNLDGIMTTITSFVNKLKGALSTVAFSGSYNDLSDKPTISTVNDGTLTIQKNGTNVATFTANQSAAATANITVPTAVSELTNDSGYLTASSNLDASKLTSGTVDIERLPQGALERLIKVANEAARYALTIAEVQLGDTVQQLDTGIMYVVTDTDHLDSAAGYTEYTAGTAASVPWSGVTGKPTFAAVATSGAYSDLTGTPTIPTVNNATLTIQRNGTTVDTFTANASVDKTININTADDTKIPLAGSNQISGDLIPATTDAYDLGGSSYQWNNAYIKSLTINGVACGDILTHNANEFVDVTTAQTISGDKTFTNRLTYKAKNTIAGDSTSSNFAGSFNFTDKNDVQIGTFGLSVFNNNGYTEQVLNIINPLWFNDNTKTKSFAVRLRVMHETGTVLFSPAPNNTIDLGSTTSKWKTINGINPGALSLQGTGIIDVSSNITVLDGSTANKFTPQINGWLHINGTGAANDGFIYVVQGSIGMMSANNAAMLRCAVLIPVVAGVEVSVTCKLNSLTWANIASCQGNI